MPRLPLKERSALVIRSAAPFEIVIRSVAKVPTAPRFRSALTWRVPEVIASLFVKLLTPPSTNVPTPFLMMDGMLPPPAITDEIVAVAPVPRALTVIVPLFVLLLIVNVEPLTIQPAADVVSASPKTRFPMV